MDLIFYEWSEKLVRCVLYDYFMRFCFISLAVELQYSLCGYNIMVT